MAQNNKGPDLGNGGNAEQGLVPPKTHSMVEGALPRDCVAALVYTTFPDRERAIAAGRALVEARRAGCINILPAMTSIYVWNGVTEVADEVVLIAKVPTEHVLAAMAALRALHPYETPALLVLPVAVANADYLDWLRGGTQVPEI